MMDRPAYGAGHLHHSYPGPDWNSIPFGMHAQLPGPLCAGRPAAAVSTGGIYQQELQTWLDRMLLSTLRSISCMIQNLRTSDGCVYLMLCWLFAGGTH